jgi:hypothetical protein
MVYCNLKGGLANMLFQIAATKSFSLDKGVDCSFPNFNTVLDYLNNDTFYNPTLKHSYDYKIFLGHINTSKPKNTIPTYYFPFEYQNIQLPDDEFFIDGFFQSEKYFKHNRDKILEYFKIPKSILKTIQEKYGNLLNKRTTSIHVRRGDYEKHPNHHPMQSINYYLESIEELKKETDLFMVFSDDIEWCKNNIKLANCVYIEGEKDYIELFLMSKCDNNIISNSSFSWWGAWLNANKNKIVIGPKQWFGPAIKHYTGDILPETWLKK